MTVGIVRAPSPGAWEGETLMSLLEGSSRVSQLKVSDDVRECHIQGQAGPGPVVLVHYITYTTIFAVTNPTESNYKIVWDGREL